MFSFDLDGKISLSGIETFKKYKLLLCVFLAKLLFINLILIFPEKSKE